MNENKNEYTLLDKILMTLIFCSTLFSIGTEFYLFIIPRNKGLTFSEFKPFQQKLYIGLFISLFIMSVSFIIAIIISANFINIANKMCVAFTYENNPMTNLLEKSLGYFFFC